MDQNGIHIAVPFPTLGLYTVDARDPDLNAAICRAYNNWLYEEYLAADRRRLIGVGMVTLASTSARRSTSCGTPSRRRLQGHLSQTEPSRRAGVARPRARPVLGQARAAGCRSCSMKALTGGADGRARPLRQFLHDAHDLPPVRADAGGPVDDRGRRRPSASRDLKIAFLESGCGWLPFWLHRMHGALGRSGRTRCRGLRPTRSNASAGNA